MPRSPPIRAAADDGLESRSPGLDVLAGTERHETALLGEPLEQARGIRDVTVFQEGGDMHNRVSAIFLTGSGRSFRSSPRRSIPLVKGRPMKRHILVYGISGGVLIALLKSIEYRYLVMEHSIEIYGGLIAAIFAVLGIWLGLKLTRNKETVVVKEVPAAASKPFTLNESKLEELGITRRELEILGLIAEGLSNREIKGFMQ